MSLILVVSIAVRLVAMAWTIRLWRRLRDDRIAFLTVMLGLMVLRQTLTLDLWSEGGGPAYLGRVEELPGLAVSVMAVLAVAFLARILLERRAREDELERIFQVLPDRYFRVAPDGTVVDDRGAGNPDLRAPPAEFPGRRDGNWVEPENAALFETHFARAVASGGLETYESSVSTPGGRRIYETRLSAVPEGGAISIVREVTEQRQAEGALREGEHRLRLLTNQIPAILWTVDKDLHITSSTGAGLRVLGLKPGEVVGRTLYEYAGATDPNHPIIAPHLRALAGESVSGEVCWQGATLQRHIEPLRDDRGAVVGVIGLALDITARKEAEERLRASERSLAEAQRIARLGTWTWEVAQDALHWCDEVLRMFGVARGAEPRDSRSFLERIHPDDRDDTAERLAALSAGADTYHAEHRILRPDGSCRHLVCEGRASRDAGGSLLRLAGTALDVTALKEAEAELRSSREQLRNLASRSQRVREEERAAVVREIHDELGQTLTGMRMDLVWMTKRPGHADTEQRVESLLLLVDRTLDAMRKLAARLRPAMLDDLGLEAALEAMAQDIARRAGLSCELELAALGLPRDADRETALYRIAQEALTNVVRHAGARRVHIRLREDGGAVSLEVCDDGRGISPAQLGNPGSLGLAGMRERARELGGTVEVRCARTGGTVVACSMPLRRGAGERLAT